MGEEPLQEAEIGKSAPQPPSAVDTASAQQSANYVNQYSPFGSSTYTQTGTGPTGVPTYRQDTSLSPQVQQAVDASLGAQTNVANTARQLSGNLGNQLGQPLDWSAQQSYLNNITAQNLNPEWDRMNEQNLTELTNRGLRPGSTAYDQQRNQFTQSRSQAYNSANANNFNTALQSQLALRNQPINELTALLSAGQVQPPQFQNVPGIDVAGIQNANYGQQLGAYNANQAQMGGLFSAGASLIPGLFALSDRRAKTDIKKIGQTDAGTPIYQFRYKHGGPTQIGYMAQDLLETHPEAVTMGPDGFYRVNYDMVS